MGYDMVERPLIRDDEEMRIEENMAIVCHPGVLNSRMFVHNTDLYFDRGKWSLRMSASLAQANIHNLLTL
jgi:hypothetical protein